jgi:hypothetical protein
MCADISRFLQQRNDNDELRGPAAATAQPGHVVTDNHPHASGGRVLSQTHRSGQC